MATPMAPPIWRDVLNAADAAPCNSLDTVLRVCAVIVGTNSPDENPVNRRVKRVHHRGRWNLAKKSINISDVININCPRYSTCILLCLIANFDAVRLPTATKPVKGKNANPLNIDESL